MRLSFLIYLCVCVCVCSGKAEVVSYRIVMESMEIEVTISSGSDHIGSCSGAVDVGASGDADDGKGKNKSSRGMYVVWEDLTVVLPNFGNGPTRRLLNGLTGFAQPARLMAIMGPSGSGKSTLLDSLAGRLSGDAVMTGSVLLNGKHRKLDYGGVAYVTQEDVLLGTLSVKETITYSAHLRLPPNMSREEVEGVVEATIMEMGLQDCADRLVGNWHLRGISGGEKKRLSIGLQVLTRPPLLFLDEPTTGLDSASAFFVTRTLRNLARDGRTVVSSIHQPSSEVFALFDDLFLLSAGQTVYFGEANMAVQFFAEAGFPCPSRRNPSDHFLRCINSDFDNVTATLLGSNRICDVQKSSLSSSMNMAAEQIKAKLVETYKYSNFAKGARAKIKGILIIEGLVTETKRGSQAGWRKQLLTLIKRSFVNMSRDVGYYWLRIAVYIAVSICAGSIFFDVGTSYTAIFARGSCGGFVSGFMTFMSIGGFPSFIEEMKVFYKERLNGHYGVGVFILSNFLSSLPFLVVISFSSATILHQMVKFRPGFSHLLYNCLDLTSSIAVIESCMMVVASLVPNFLTGLVVGAGFIGVMMMTAGYFRFLPDLPKPFWRYPISYINYMSWGLQGAYKNDMIGLEFDPQQPGDPKIKGEDVINTMLGVSLDHSKWWDLFAVVAILIFYRLLFFTILKLRERTSPFFRTLYARRTLHHLRKRPSFRKMPSFPSKRHKPIYSLSSQEDLNSPIH